MCQGTILLESLPERTQMNRVQEKSQICKFTYLQTFGYYIYMRKFYYFYLELLYLRIRIQFGFSVKNTTRFPKEIDRT
jgi:hypothetical protein